MTVLGQRSHASTFYKTIYALGARGSHQKFKIYTRHKHWVFSEQFCCQGKKPPNSPIIQKGSREMKLRLGRMRERGFNQEKCIFRIGKIFYICLKIE